MIQAVFFEQYAALDLDFAIVDGRKSVFQFQKKICKLREGCFGELGLEGSYFNQFRQPVCDKNLIKQILDQIARLYQIESELRERPITEDTTKRLTEAALPKLLPHAVD